MAHTEPQAGAQPPAQTVSRTRPLTESPTLSDKAVHFLCEGRASFAFAADDARLVLPYLRWVSYAPGSYLYKEGDQTGTSYMLLLLEGDVSVDTGASGRADRVAISVLGPGSLIGEMALLDGAARSASCTAVTTVQAAGMSHAGLELLAQEHPQVAFKMLVYLARNTIDRLRALSEQLQMYDQLNVSLRQEVDQLRQARGRAG